ncbi:pirin family protein [Streptomyces spiramenti]|uniref:Pirin family protein n=1 Tax=Streptomyces spiramenti TaxID=2720606 RepID=A0ABX1ARP7_9ACTN|nr:pirin family protein [Streptomyces spiramenti]NJP68821.1 pirin family protein [Streptomyces spiramenti]
MSNLDARPAPADCGAERHPGPTRDLLPGRLTPLGESTVVRRLLPSLGRRMVGAWIFVDHYGPDDIAGEAGMQVPPHPHIGLQTVSWLHDGEVLHRDSLGSLSTIRPRELALMTSGRGISHSEESPREHARLLHGAQLWVALPQEHKDTGPAFEHHRELPTFAGGGGVNGTLILGEFDGATSPGTVHTPLTGVDLALAEGAETRLPLVEEFEYAVLAMSGACTVDEVRVEPGSLLYLGQGRRELPVRADTDAKVMLLGGLPFDERLVMWWNFVGRSHEEVASARADWAAGSRFGSVEGYDGAALTAPALPPVHLKARGRTR